MARSGSADWQSISIGWNRRRARGIAGARLCAEHQPQHAAEMGAWHFPERPDRFAAAAAGSADTAALLRLRLRRAAPYRRLAVGSRSSSQQAGSLRNSRHSVWATGYRFLESRHDFLAAHWDQEP